MYGFDVKIVRRESSVGTECQKGMVLGQGDWVRTGAGSTCTLGFGAEGKNRITIEENSLVIVKIDGFCKMQLLSGGLYAVLEDVSKGESFKVLTPSVITEAMSSGWSIKDNGSYTNVVVFDNDVFVCGLNEDGTPRDKKFWVKEGFQRKTVRFEDPGEMEKAPSEFIAWFKEQVLANFLDKTLPAGEDGAGKPGNNMKSGKDNKIIVDGKEVDLLEYLYRQRLQKNTGQE
jgi:hypothetical protein